MGITEKIEQRMAMGPTDDSWYNPGGFYYGGAGTKTKSGSSVSELNAMQLAIVWCCIKILSEDSASLPLPFYRKLPGGGKERATGHPNYSLLHDSPNPEMTAFSFRETGMSHLVGWGNWYAEKQFGSGTIGRDQVKALWPITPNRVKSKRNEKKQLVYHISMTGTGLPDVILPKRNVLHIPGLSFNGLVGYSPIAAAREAIGLGKTLEEFGSAYFENGMHPSVVVSMQGSMKDSKAFHTAWNELYAGLGNAHRMMLLEETQKVEKLGIPNEEAQFLESRKFQNVDIGSRIYRLPPQMYGEYEKAASYASAEQFSLDYVVKTLRPWLVRIEQALNMSLISPAEKGELFFEHLIDGLMRGDAAARGEYYNKLFTVGGISPNEINELENRNPIGPEGNKRFVPLNMIPLEDAGKQQDSDTDNRTIYRTRLESAYRPLLSDAVGRITRKESQRVNWILKNQGDNGALGEFYQELPDYIKKQSNPAFLSFAEALMGMETELNGRDYGSFKAETQRFIDVFCTGFAENYVETSRNLGSEEGEWTERDAGSIAEAQIKSLGDAFIGHLQALTGTK